MPDLSGHKDTPRLIPVMTESTRQRISHCKARADPQVGENT